VRVLVTGATGSIGSTLCDALLARGDEVVGLTRDPAKAKPGNPTVTWFAWQPAIERPPPAAFEQVDAVVNLVGEEINQRLSDEAKARIRDSRVKSAKNLIDGIAALDKPPSVFVAQSAIGYYGDRGAKMLDEESRPGEGFGSELPVEWETAQREAAKHVGRFVLLRTGLILDKDHGLLGQLLPPFKLGVGGPLAGGDQYMSWIHLDDEIGLILWALDTEAATDTINATAPHPVTNKEFSKALGAAVNRPAFIPAPKLAVIALRGRELADMVVGSARVMPRRALDLGYSFRFPEVGPALEDAVNRD
jgi:uncharacterized protein